MKKQWEAPIVTTLDVSLPRPLTSKPEDIECISIQSGSGPVLYFPAIED